MKNIVFLLATLFLSCQLMAQQRSVSGTVTDAATGETIIGANVTVKGTTTGVATDMDGRFTMSVPIGNVTLKFSYIGYVDKEVTLRANQAVINVSLSEDSKQLDEVVVVGYGTMKKSDLSGASVSVGESAIKSTIATNLDQALQGRASGVAATLTSGAPGSSMSISIRGQGTIGASASPIYVIDGVIWQGGNTSGLSLGLNTGNGAGTISPLSNLNPSDILSMEILKDASATAIYGSQGSNGVVLITTKRGQSGEAKFTYEGMFGVQEQATRLKMMNLRQYAAYNDAIAKQTSGGTATPEYQDPSLLGAGTDWQSAIFRPAPMTQHTISASGGTDKVHYYLSGSYMDQVGTLIGSDFQRYSGRINLDAELKSWLKIGLNTMYSNTNENLLRAEGQEGVLTYSLLTPPDIAIYDTEGNFSSQVRQGYTRVNPIAIAELDKNKLNRQKLNGNIFLDITPVKNLTWHAELGYDLGWSKSSAWKPTYNFGGSIIRDKNSLSWQNNKSLYWNLKNYVTYNGKIGKHSFSAMAGQETSESSWEYQYILGKALPDNTILNPQLGADAQSFNDGWGSSANVSVFTRETYNYDDRYMFTYTFRYDGSSNFGPNRRWAPFHSFAGSWRFTNEKFFEPLKTIVSNGKIRIGWGQTGNQSIGGGKWDASLVVFPTGLGQAFKQNQIANPNIQWETQEQWNFGLDLSFLKDRISLTIDAYQKTSKDLLMQAQLPTYFGSRGNGNSALAAPWGNFGELQNRGLEISLSTHNLVGEFNWSSEFQISFNKNKLIALQGVDASGLEGYGQWNDIISLSEIGGPLYDFYGYIFDGVYKDKADIEKHLWGEIPANYNRYSTVFVGDAKYRDISGPEGKPDGKIDTYDRTHIGSPLPKFTFGFNNSFSWKNFDLNIFMQGSYGGKVFNALGRDLTSMGYWSNQLQKAMGYARLVAIDPNKTYPTSVNGQVINNWFEDIDNVRVENPDTKFTRAGQGLPYNNSRISTQYIEDNSYLRIKNISLGYSIPKKWLKKFHIDGLRTYINIQNLVTFTKYTGYDPEVGLNAQDSSGLVFGFDQGRYPSPRVYSFGVNLTF